MNPPLLSNTPRAPSGWARIEDAMRRATPFWDVPFGVLRLLAVDGVLRIAKLRFISLRYWLSARLLAGSWEFFEVIGLVRFATLD